MPNKDKNTEIPQCVQPAVMQSVIIEELLQKIKFVLSCGNEAQAERIIEQFVFHQEELTIDFADWLTKKGNYNINNWNKSTKEKLEIYKKGEEL